MRPVEQAFQFCPSCGASVEQRVNPLSCACGFRYFFNPPSAVGGLLRDPEGNMLFIRRERDPGKGKLGMPGGFIDPGETGEDAVRRETQEEVGLEVSKLDYLTSHPNVYAYAGVVYQVIDFFYTAEVAHFDNIERNEEEVSEWIIARPESMNGDDFAFASNWFAVQTFVRRFVQS